MIEKLPLELVLIVTEYLYNRPLEYWRLRRTCKQLLGRIPPTVDVPVSVAIDLLEDYKDEERTVIRFNGCVMSHEEYFWFREHKRWTELLDWLVSYPGRIPKDLVMYIYMDVIDMHEHAIARKRPDWITRLLNVHGSLGAEFKSYSRQDDEWEKLWTNYFRVDNVPIQPNQKRLDLLFNYALWQSPNVARLLLTMGANPWNKSDLSYQLTCACNTGAWDIILVLLKRTPNARIPLVDILNTECSGELFGKILTLPGASDLASYTENGMTLVVCALKAKKDRVEITRLLLDRHIGYSDIWYSFVNRGTVDSEATAPLYELMFDRGAEIGDASHWFDSMLETTSGLSGQAGILQAFTKKYHGRII